MLENNTFNATWGKSLKVTTLLTCFLLPAVFSFGAYMSQKIWAKWKTTMVLLPFVTTAISALFSIRNYRLQENQLIIQGLSWQTTIEIGDLNSVEANLDAMCKSIRLFGNGGLFRNKLLGRHRAFATSPGTLSYSDFPIGQSSSHRKTLRVSRR